MRRHASTFPFAFLLAACLVAPGSRAQDRPLVDLQGFTPREVRMEAFALDSRQELRVEAVGALSRDRSRHFWDRWSHDRPDYWPGNAWILDARTREVVWVLSEAETRSEHDGLRSYKGSITLPPGVYEAYYASFAGTGMTVYRDNGGLARLANRVKDVLDEAFDSEDRPGRRKDRDGRVEERTYQGEFVDNGAYRDFRFFLQGRGRGVGEEAVASARAAFRETAFVSMTSLGDEAYREAGFVLKEPTDVEIYAVGEARGDESYDYGWILNADTRQRVWTMDDRHSDHAGGSDKNRVVRQTLSLPAGRYAALFVTDDSHSTDEWNAAPAFDLAFWGLTLRVKRPADRARVEPFTYELLPAKEAFVALTGLGDDALATQGFTLKRAMEVRIYALGEGRDGDMFDFGWIEDARSHRRVWEMRHRDTEHAGGAQKNRVFDGVVSLPAGDYMAYFITDDSHAYRAWNSGAPIAGERWGLTLLPAVGTLDRTLVGAYEAREDPNLFAGLTPIRDGAYERRRFTLDRDQPVRIYALGEGDDGHMYDYGWIEDARTGRTVWEMTYRMTDHAGGARKNRVVDVELSLPAGEYVLYYKADGSHAFGDWNAPPPSDPIHWGITVYRASGQ